MLNHQKLLAVKKLTNRVLFANSAQSFHRRPQAKVDRSEKLGLPVAPASPKLRAGVILELKLSRIAHSARLTGLFRLNLLLVQGRTLRLLWWGGR